LNEEYVLKRMAAASPRELAASRSTSLKTLEAWSQLPAFGTDDMNVAVWYEENRKNIHERIEKMKGDAVAYDVAALMRSNKDGGLAGVMQVLSMLPVAEKEEVIKRLSKA
jgi:acetyl-CoA carboxylase/biotin carboxylase 1